MMNKELLKGTLNVILLRLFNERGQMYGYEITQCVKEMSGGKLLIKEGSLYPALHKLEADGLLIAEDVYVGRRIRRYYRLTEAGKINATEAVDELKAFIRMIDHLITAQPDLSYGDTTD